MLFLFCLLFTNIIITIEIKQTSNIKQLNIINDTLILNKPIN